MTKRDFELIASVIRYEYAVARTRKDITGAATIRRIVSHMSAKLVDRNPRFKSERFQLACGMER